MKTIFGKTVRTELDEAVDPRRTALLVVDMQNDFGHPDGYFATHDGYDMGAFPSAMERIDELVEPARAVGVMVVWIKNEALPGGRSDSPAWLSMKAAMVDEPIYTLQNSWGQEFLAPLGPRDDEPVVTKYRSSAFDYTALDLILRSNGIESVVVCGCVTEGCVLATARSAAFHDYYVGIVEDGVVSMRPNLHVAALDVLRGFHRVLPAAEYAAVWRR